MKVIQRNGRYRLVPAGNEARDYCKTFPVPWLTYDQYIKCLMLECFIHVRVNGHGTSNMRVFATKWHPFHFLADTNGSSRTCIAYAGSTQITYNDKTAEFKSVAAAIDGIVNAKKLGFAWQQSLH